MNRIKLIVSCVALSACIATAQEMSNEWHQQKAASWVRATQDFPQSAYPGPFKTRMLEIEAWAKENNQELYYNSSKPYLLAQMVQQERDESLATEQQAARERLRASGNLKSPQASTTSNSQPAGNQFSSSVNSERGGLTGSAVGAIWLGSTIIIIVAFGVAWALHWIIRPRDGAASASALGRKWAAWIVVIGTISLLPRFFRKMDANSFVLWAMSVTIFGASAFFIGWIIGLIKYRGRKGTDTNAVDSPTQSDDAGETSRESYELFNNLPERQFHPEEPEIKSASPIMKKTEFEVVIPEGTELEDGYVQMRHNAKYSLNLKNHRWGPCDAEVTIDGIHVGTWRIESRNEIRIERPVHDTGHFTFFEVATKEAELAGIVKNSDNGLISVTFKPKKEMEGLRASELPPRFGAGATGLTGESQQRFRDAPEIEHDMARAFTIHLRLVSRKPDIRPLAPRSTPIPPPVG